MQKSLKRKKKSKLLFIKLNFKMLDSFIDTWIKKKESSMLVFNFKSDLEKLTLKFI